MNALPLSFVNMKLVPEEMLAARMETVKTLSEDENESYMIGKDTETGEHYLHYAVRHLNVAAGGTEEVYHHLMPLGHDDVIAFAIGGPDYSYPGAWSRPYLRNGPNGGYVWYDPDGAAGEAVAYAAVAKRMRAKLEQFHRQGKGGEDEVKKLMEEIEKLFPPM